MDDVPKGPQRGCPHRTDACCLSCLHTLHERIEKMTEETTRLQQTVNTGFTTLPKLKDRIAYLEEKVRDHERNESSWAPDFRSLKSLVDAVGAYQQGRTNEQPVIELYFQLKGLLASGTIREPRT